MAITAAPTLGGFSGFLNPEQSQAIFDRAAQQSVVQRLDPQVPLGIGGAAVPVTTGKPSAGWVAEGAHEAGQRRGDDPQDDEPEEARDHRRRVR